MPEEKSAILPLGADIASTTDKTFEKLNLLYVGTLFNRDVHKTIEGLAIAIKENPQMDIYYDIVGDGIGNELAELKQLVADKKLENHIKLHGYIQHKELKSFLDKCNIGVSFVPMTEYYEFQPATKSFEYVLSGLYTIATSTYCNKEIINEENGILIEDSPASFANGIKEIYNRRTNIKADKIRQTLTPYLWKNIVKNEMSLILNNYKQKYGL